MKVVGTSNEGQSQQRYQTGTSSQKNSAFHNRDDPAKKDCISPQNGLICWGQKAIAQS